MYNVENETFRSKKCLPYFANVFKIMNQPNLHLFIECWGYDVETPDMNTQPVNKSWTTC